MEGFAGSKRQKNELVSLLEEETTSADIVIVGAGFTGLYLAYRLIKKHPELKHRIEIHEKSLRIGGRIYTEKRHGFIMEYGPMRFEPELQTNFRDLLVELNIEWKKFPTYANPRISPDYNKLHLQEIQAIEHNKDIAPTFALIKLALSLILGKQWDIEHDDIHNPFRKALKSKLRVHGRFRGRKLNSMGLWDVFSQVLSKEAIDFLMLKATFYHLLAENPNAAEQISFILDVLATIRSSLITVSKGVYEIIEKLYDLVKDDVKIFLGSQVLGVTEAKGEEKTVTLMISKSSNSQEMMMMMEQNQPYKKIQCKHAIFTLAQYAYTQLSGLPIEIQPLLYSVKCVDLFKIFVILSNPPWDKNSPPPPNTHGDKIPCREVQYHSNEDGSLGMIMIYGDIPTINYYKPFLNSNSGVIPEFDSNEYLKERLEAYLVEMFPQDFQSFSIIHYGILDWAESSYRAAIHLWKPKYCSLEVIEKLASFGPSNRLHICGETFSDYQGFIEGCIRTSDTVVSDILKKDFFAVS